MSLVTLAPQKMMACFCSLCFVVPSFVSFLFFVVWDHSRMWMWFQCPEAISLSAHSPCFGRGQGCVCVCVCVCGWGGGGGVPLYIHFGLSFHCTTHVVTHVFHTIPYCTILYTWILSRLHASPWRKEKSEICLLNVFFFVLFFYLIFLNSDCAILDIGQRNEEGKNKTKNFP